MCWLCTVNKAAVGDTLSSMSCSQARITAGYLYQWRIQGRHWRASPPPNGNPGSCSKTFLFPAQDRQENDNRRSQKLPRPFPW